MSNLSFKIRRNAPLTGAKTLVKRSRKSLYDQCEFEKMNVNDSICLKTYKVGTQIDPKEKISIYGSIRRALKAKNLDIKNYKLVERPMNRNLEFCIYKVS